MSKPKAASAPAPESGSVQTSAPLSADAPAAAPATSCAGCGNCGGQCQEKPAHHQPTPPRPRDQYTGKAGSYVRDPKTGERKPATE